MGSIRVELVENLVLLPDKLHVFALEQMFLVCQDDVETGLSLVVLRASVVFDAETTGLVLQTLLREYRAHLKVVS